MTSRRFRVSEPPSLLVGPLRRTDSVSVFVQVSTSRSHPRSPSCTCLCERFRSEKMVSPRRKELERFGRLTNRFSLFFHLSEGAKKSIVSTLLRPGALVTRNSSHNVQTTANAHANANNARQQQGSQRNRGSTVAAGGVARNGSSAAAAAGTGTANSSRANAQDGSSHGGGCKCVIM